MRQRVSAVEHELSDRDLALRIDRPQRSEVDRRGLEQQAGGGSGFRGQRRRRSAGAGECIARQGFRRELEGDLLRRARCRDGGLTREMTGAEHQIDIGERHVGR